MKCVLCEKEYEPFVLHITGRLDVGEIVTLTVRPASTIDKSAACEKCLRKALKNSRVYGGYIELVEK